MAQQEEQVEVLAEFMPRFRYGQVLPANTAVRLGPGYQFYRLVPLDVIEITTVLGITDYTREGVEAAIGNFPTCVDLLAHEGVDRMVLAGVPISAQLGRKKVREHLDEAQQRSGVPCDAPLEAMIAALHHLAVDRVTIGSRWAGALNEALVQYLAEGDIEVSSVTSRGQWARQAFAMSLDAGMQAAVAVGREAARLDPEAGAIIVPGGAALSLHAIPMLESEFGKPVLTNANAEIWEGLVHTGIVPPVKGWGALLAGK